MKYELSCFGEYASLNERCKVCEDEAWCAVATRYDNEHNKEVSDGDTR